MNDSKVNNVVDLKEWARTKLWAPDAYLIHQKKEKHLVTVVYYQARIVEPPKTENITDAMFNHPFNKLS